MEVLLTWKAVFLWPSASEAVTALSSMGSLLPMELAGLCSSSRYLVGGPLYLGKEAPSLLSECHLQL